MKELYVLFGVKTADIEEARRWIEVATSWKGNGFFSEYCGDYYLFGAMGDGEDIRLCSGLSEDEDGQYPTEPDFPEWKILAYLNESSEGSNVLKELQSRSDQFEKLRTKVFDD